jgi:DNA repair exonuclease SbcCD ATPase subunit
MEIPFADLESNLKVDKIYHLSDIHIKLQKRHEEYRSVFKTLYQTLTKEKEMNPKSTGIIVITGDILHSKTELSPECVSLTAEFFQKLSEIMPLFIIAGNHDANLNNHDRLDSLTPIIEKVMRKSTCYYLKESGIYKYGNIAFGLTSVFDYHVVSADLIEQLELTGIDHKIGLFHGRVDGAITDTGAIMTGEKGINKDSFKGYDFTLLGDIHKYQQLKTNSIAYAGSLIQQNHGESLRNHGVLIWDLSSKTCQIKEIPNQYGYITLKLKEGKLIKHKEDQIPNYCYLRLEIDAKTSKEDRDKIINDFKKNRTILELILVENDIHKTDQESDDVKSLSFNISDDQFQNSEIEKYLKTKGLDANVINTIKKLNTDYNSKILTTETILGSSWKIKSVEFNDVNCYGPDNKIDFTKCKGIVGIVAPNHIGKSTILDVILYTLFDKTSRKGNAKDFIRLGQKTFKTKVEIEMGNKEYHIIKKGTLKTQGTMSVQINFYSYHTDATDNKKVKTELDGKTPAETKKVIESYFGTYDDMVMTTISLQNNNTQFADATTTERRREFEKLLRINVFEKLKDLAQDDYREKKAIIKHLYSEIPEDCLKNLLDEHMSIEDEYKRTEIELELQKTDLQKYRDQESSLMINVGSLLNQIPKEYQKMAQKGLLTEHRKNLEKSINLIKKELENTEDYSSTTLEEWQKKEKERTKKLKTLDSQLEELYSQIHPIKGFQEHTSETKNLDLKKTEKETRDNTLQISKLGKKIEELKNCNWEEKELILKTCLQINQKQKEKYPDQGPFKDFYKSLEETINEVLDQIYHPGTEEDLQKLNLERNKLKKDNQNLQELIEKYKKIENNLENKVNNAKIEKDISKLKKEKTKLEESGFELEQYQKALKLKDLEKELDKLNLVEDTIKEYAIKQDELQKIMAQVLKGDENLNLLSTKRGDLKGSIGIIEAEMKSLTEKKKILESEIVSADFISTYLDCLKKVPFFIIDTIVPQLERVVNQMLACLVDFTISVVITEKDLNVYINLAKGQIPLSNSSGFQKFVGSLFLRMGLIKISNLPKANFIAIDEGWSNFDYENLNNVHLIMDYLRTQFDFVLLVSHLPIMKEQADMQINLKVYNKKDDLEKLTNVIYPPLPKNT